MATENSLIAGLPNKARSALLSLCETVELQFGAALCKPGSTTRHVYFPTDSFVSLIATLDGEPSLEVGMVGSEGMVGAQLALGVRSVPLLGLVQGAGTASRIGTAAFCQELARSPPLREALHRYIYVLMGQLAISAACLRGHAIAPRLARWLLMTQDRAHSSSFHVTHEFLAYMLGVRRVGITTAAGTLQRTGLIEYKRGDLTVLDRKGLLAASCSCYAADRKVYAGVMK